ncbi:MAG: NACHT domain-containing protein [Crocosphaera sp.]|nr:NACHT domain-containing protein [Crocosphaera sp.]
MSVYKPEATKGVPMENIYIPLTVVPEAASKEDKASRIDPLSLLTLGKRNVILGDPGSGKSTLLKFLSLAGISEKLQKNKRYQTSPDARLPILIILRRYADELKSRHNLSLIDYIQEVIEGDFSLKSIDAEFFQYYLETGQTILFFDGLDELPDSQYKKTVKDRICTLDSSYPGNTIIVTSRIVGYDSYFRFDEKQFSHYRLTTLELPEIRQFINDWYTVRISNKKERRENIDDLANLLEDDDYKAIRELAENPLLLTIITLVHRIDAVLPDERVVLYQKCTETLLNTWHGWKFKSSTKRKGKGKIERRNRQRMEAIANWMHEKSLSTEAKQRAVVTYDELKDFLSNYIQNPEKTTDDKYEAQDLAEEFLEFIKKRAGLLIEAGDKQYSFVHLTFQEYLTSCYLITKGETEGVRYIWQIIEAKCSEPRWQEVIRLLIANLKANESQEFLVEQILEINENNAELNISLLLGGLLLDGIEAAETLAEDILTHVFTSSIKVKELDKLRPLLSILRIWSAKEPSNDTMIRSVFSSLWKTTTDLTEKKSLSLIAYTLNWTEDEINELTEETVIYQENEVNFLQLFFGEVDTIQQSDLLTQNIELFWAFQDHLSSTSFTGTLLAAISQSLNSSLGRESFSKRIFEQYLIHIHYKVELGTFLHFTFYISQLTINNQFLDNQKTKWSLDQARDRVLDRARDQVLDRAGVLASVLASVLDGDRARDRTRDRIRDLDRDRVLNQVLGPGWDRALHRFPDRGDRDLGRNLDLNLDLNLALGNNEHFWQAILDDSKAYSLILYLFCDIFALEPRAQWWEALRVSFLPKVPERIPLFDPDLWSQVELAFTEGTPTQADIYFAAWQLLLDVWLYVFEYYDSPDETIVAQLVNLTRDNPAPPLRIAHCIRDIAYGDESRTDDLIAMVNSQDPEYQGIFERCYWKDTTDAEIEETMENN